MLGGSGEIGYAELRFRTRDQRIKRGCGSSKAHIHQRFVGSKSRCAIKCAIAF